MLAGRREPGSGAVRPGSSAAAAGAAAATACGRPRGARRRWRRNQHDRGRLWGGGEIRKTPVNPRVAMLASVLRRKSRKRVDVEDCSCFAVLCRAMIANIFCGLPSEIRLPVELCFVGEPPNSWVRK
jgi:hypothetical protein